MENWQEIDTVAGYSISDHGRVRNDDTGRCLAMQKNQRDIFYVVLFQGGVKTVRSVATLVAEYFVEVPFNNPTDYNTVIHLDGDRTHLHAFNLAWRQRWYAIEYHKQFQSESRGFTVPVENLDTGEIFPNTWEASKHYGVIERKIVLALANGDEVWPIRNRFSFIDD